MIRLLVLDVDGVLTDGRVTLDEAGREAKTVSYRDIDAVFEARRRGLTVILLTGEDTPLVDVVGKRFAVDGVIRNRKEKLDALVAAARERGFDLDEVCYIGDSNRDAPALEAAGLGLAPADATDRAKQAADGVLGAAAGTGVVAEALGLILSPEQ